MKSQPTSEFEQNLREFDLDQRLKRVVAMLTRLQKGQYNK